MACGTLRRGIPVLLAAVACLAAAIMAAKEKVYYMDFEHVTVTYWNPKFLAYLNASARRYSRRDPTHYYSFSLKTLHPFGNNVTIYWYFYQFLSNEYRRSFVEAHHNLCDFLVNDVFGRLFQKELFRINVKTCPFPAAVYHMENLSLPNLPLLATFPFQKGRLFVNWTFTHPGGDKDRFLSGYADAVILTKYH